MAYTGHNTFLLLGEETTFNVEADTIDKDIGYTENANSSSNQNPQVIRSLGNRQADDVVAGNFDDTLSVDGYLNSGAILEMLFGQVDNTETNGDYTHTFIDEFGTPNTLPCNIKSYSIQENMSCNSDVVLTHTGCKVNSVEINLETNGTLKYSSEIIGSNVYKTDTASTRVVTKTKPLGAFQGSVSLALTGGSYTEVGIPSTLSVSLNNNIDANDLKQIGSRFNQELVPKVFEVTANFTQKFANSQEFELFLGGTSASDKVNNLDLKIQVTNGVALGSGLVEFYIELSNGMLETAEVNKAYDGVIEATYNYMGGRVTKCYFVDKVPAYFA